MIEFDDNCHQNTMKVTISKDGIDFTAVIDGSEFENALDTLLDGYFLNDWLKETMEGIAEQCCDCGTISDDELELFKGILGEIL